MCVAAILCINLVCDFSGIVIRTYRASFFIIGFYKPRSNVLILDLIVVNLSHRWCVSYSIQHSHIPCRNICEWQQWRLTVTAYAHTPLLHALYSCALFKNATDRARECESSDINLNFRFDPFNLKMLPDFVNSTPKRNGKERNGTYMNKNMFVLWVFFVQIRYMSFECAWFYFIFLFLMLMLMLLLLLWYIYFSNVGKNLMNLNFQTIRRRKRRTEKNGI